MNRQHHGTIVWAALILAIGGGRAALAAAEPTPEERLQGQLDRAAKLIDEGQIDQALPLLKLALDAAADKLPWVTARALLLQGHAEVRRRNWAAAAEHYTALLEQFPGWPQMPEALSHLGRVREAQGRTDAARQAWQRVIDECPHSWQRFEAEQHLLQLDLDAAQLGAAATRLDAYLKRFPWAEQAPWMMLAMGNALLAGDQAAEAVKRFESLRSDYPATEAWYNARRPLVEAYHKLKRDADASKLLDEVATQRPEMFVVADATHLQAQLLEDQDQWQPAAAVLKQLAERYPDTFVALRARFREAALRRKHQDLDGAIVVLGELRDKYTSAYWRVQILSLLLTLQREKEDLNAAEDTALALAELTDGTTVAADALLEAAQIQAEADRGKAAQATLEKILQLYKGPPFVPLAQQMLADLKAQGDGAGGG